MAWQREGDGNRVAARSTAHQHGRLKLLIELAVNKPPMGHGNGVGDRLEFPTSRLASKCIMHRAQVVGRHCYPFDVPCSDACARTGSVGPRCTQQLCHALAWSACVRRPSGFVSGISTHQATSSPCVYACRRSMTGKPSVPGGCAYGGGAAWAQLPGVARNQTRRIRPVPPRRLPVTDD